jgi:hypothetical protein
VRFTVDVLLRIGQTVDVDFCRKASTLAVQRVTVDKGFYDYYCQSVGPSFNQMQFSLSYLGSE